MITAWQIYWVMQLDRICTAFVVIAICSGIAAAISGVVAFDETSDGAAKFSKRMAGLCMACVFALALTPSTKTAAAMIVIPAVANNKAIQKEAGDLYGIAKEALRELAKPKPEKSE